MSNTVAQWGTFQWGKLQWGVSGATPVVGPKPTPILASVASTVPMNAATRGAGTPAVAGVASTVTLGGTVR